MRFLVEDDNSPDCPANLAKVQEGLNLLTVLLHGI